MKKYLLYVTEYSFTRNDYVINVYTVETDDIFHTIGEFMYRAFNQIKRINFVEWAQERENFWINKGFDISTFRNKYNGNGDVL